MCDIHPLARARDVSKPIPDELPVTSATFCMYVSRFLLYLSHFDLY